MTYEEALTLKAGESKILFAGGEYVFAGLYSEGHLLRKVHLLIYDEPPTLHIDSINISSCELVPKIMEEVLKLIEQERKRQIEVEGYSTDGDDIYKDNELALAAISYAIPPHIRPGKNPPSSWPWLKKHWKPSLVTNDIDGRIRELVKSCALLVAEIERQQRMKI